MGDSKPDETLDYMIKQLNQREIAFMEVVEGKTGGTT